MYVVETDREAGALGDEFPRVWRVARDARGDHPREHQPQRDEETQAKRNRDRALHPV
jgi:hypothetical protein